VEWNNPKRPPEKTGYYIGCWFFKTRIKKKKVVREIFYHLGSNGWYFSKVCGEERITNLLGWRYLPEFPEIGEILG
jgi:hypothetical protein